MGSTYPGIEGRPETGIRRNEVRERDANIASGVSDVGERFSLFCSAVRAY